MEGMYYEGNVPRATAIRQWFRHCYEDWCANQPVNIYEDALALVDLYIPLVLVGSEAESKHSKTK